MKNISRMKKMAFLGQETHAYWHSPHVRSPPLSQVLVLGFMLGKHEINQSASFVWMVNFEKLLTHQKIFFFLPLVLRFVFYHCGMWMCMMHCFYVLIGCRHKILLI